MASNIQSGRRPRVILPRSVSSVMARPGAISVLLLVLVVAVMSLTVPAFAETATAQQVGAQMGTLGLASLGQLLVMLTGGFDLSVGATSALASVVAAHAVNAWGLPGLVAGAAVGAAVGLVNGILVGFFRIQPLIATLGMLSVAQGLSLLASNAAAVPVLNSSSLAGLGYGAAGPISWQFICVVVASVAVYVLIHRLRVGRRLVMVGSQPTAAALVGVSTARALAWSYTLCGLLAGLGGVLLLARGGAGLPTDGGTLPLETIAACVIGGTALTGGRGDVPFLFVAILFVQAIAVGLGLSGTSPFIQTLVLGSVLLGAGVLEVTIRFLHRWEHAAIAGLA